MYTPLSTTETLKRYRKFVEGKLKKDEPIKMIDFISQDRTALIKFFLDEIENTAKEMMIKEIDNNGKGCGNHNGIYECCREITIETFVNLYRKKLEPLLK